MQDKLTFKKFIEHPMYDQEATKLSKSFVSWFSIFCLYFMLFSDYKVGFWWIPIWVVGIFIASLVCAFPAYIIKTLIMIKMYNKNKKCGVLFSYSLNLIDIVFLAALFLLLRWFLSVMFFV